MSELADIILVMACVICVVGWLVDHICVLSLSKWIVDKEYTPPTYEEMKACTDYVVRKLFGIR